MLSSIGGKIHDNVQQTNSEDTLRKLGLRRDVLLLHANSYKVDNPFLIILTIDKILLTQGLYALVE